jgi:hypothetical protein
VIKEFPFPEFHNENFLSEQCVYLSISGDGQVISRNKILYLCNYLPDGLSNKIRFLQFNNPNGALLNAIKTSSPDFGLVKRFKSYIQIIAFSLLIKKNFREHIKNNYSFIWSPIVIFGYFYFFYNKHRFRL